MESALGRGLVKHNPQSWHCTTTNHKPALPGARSGASTRGEQRMPPQSKQPVSSHSMPRVDCSTGDSRSRAKKPMEVPSLDWWFRTILFQPVTVKYRIFRNQDGK